MKYSLTIRKEAELDINSAFEYYENLRLGLGHNFLLCIEAYWRKTWLDLEKSYFSH